VFGEYRSEKDWEGSNHGVITALNHYHGIYLERLRKSRKNRRIAGVPAEL
jgi:hypothetical protein